MSTRLRTKLVRVYALQVLLISVAALIGVYITYLIVQDVLSRQALNQEADYFWQLLADNPQTPLPNTANMRAYLSDRPDSQVPEVLSELDVGFGRVEALSGSPLVHVSEQNGQRLYLIFAEAEVSELVFYFGLAPLAAVLLTVYILLFLTYRLSHRAISPMLNVANALEKVDFRASEQLAIPTAGAEIDHETRLMIDALRSFSERLHAFVERERTFTRNAGHELRTPIAVMKGCLELLNTDKVDDRKQIYERMTRVMADMEAMLETLLMLARETAVTSEEAVSIGQVIAEEIELLADFAETKGNRLSFEEEDPAMCHVKPSVAAIIFANLIRNALTYTDNGEVIITVTQDYVSIRDTGIGMSPEEEESAFTAFYRGEKAKETATGQGLGLALVKRLTDQLKWRVEVSSALGEGSTFKVYYS